MNANEAGDSTGARYNPGGEDPRATPVYPLLAVNERDARAEPNITEHTTVYPPPHTEQYGNPQGNDEGDEEGEEEVEVVQRWVYLDTDAVHHLSSTAILARKMFLYSSRKSVIILVRFLLLVFLWAQTGVLTCYTYIYYNSVFHYSILSVQESALRWIFSDERPHTILSHVSYKPLLLGMFVYGPLALSFLTMLTFSPILVFPKQIARVLYWQRKCTLWGHYIGCNMEEHFSTTISHCSDRISYPFLLSKNLVHHIKHLNKRKFWIVLWNKVVCRFSPRCRLLEKSSHRPDDGKGVDSEGPTVHLAVQYISLVCFLPVALVAIVLHTLPIFSVFTNIALNAETLLLPKCCQRFSNRRYLLFLTVPVTLLGLVLLLFPVFDLMILWSNVLIFLLIDALRNSGEMLPKLIFMFSTVLYTRQAFVDFNDSYRHLKASIFSSAQALDGKSLVLRSDGKTPLLTTVGAHGLELALPRGVFDEICSLILPYRVYMAKTILKLVATVAFIVLLFALVNEYQIFSDVTSTSEALLSILTVSIPRVLGMMKSEGYTALREMRQGQAINVTLTKLTQPRGAKPSDNM